MTLTDLPVEIIEIILQKTCDSFRWHREADSLFAVARSGWVAADVETREAFKT